MFETQETVSCSQKFLASWLDLLCQWNDVGRVKFSENPVIPGFICRIGLTCQALAYFAVIGAVITGALAFAKWAWRFLQG